ncbi:MAG: cache domain-containing protein [Proteobacteria bacterium]|nr:cache domain-containing protein [Pseudomonadota bacterium]
MTRIFSRLSGRILGTFTALLLGLSLIYGSLASHFGRQMILRSSSNEMRVLALVLSQLIQKQFSSLENNLDAIQDDEAIFHSLEYGDRTGSVSNYLSAQLLRYPMFEDLMIFNKRGECIGSTDSEWFNISGKSNAFFKDGLVEFNFPPIYGTETAGKVQLVSAPITGNSDNSIGVIVGIIRLNTVYDLMDQKIGLTENRDAFLLDEDLRFITPANDGPKELVESHLASTALKDHLRDDSWVGEYLNYNGTKVLGTVVKIPGYSWYIVVERRYEGVVKQVSAIQNVIGSVSVGLLIIFVVASLVIGRSVTKPLLQLVESTRSIGSGHLKVPIQTQSTIEEIEFLAIEFERMRRKVAISQERLKERLEVSEALRLESERLAAIGTLASSLAHEIRNPLNAMSLLLSRLKGLLDHPVGKSIVQDVFGEVARLDRLVNSILDYSRPLQLNKRDMDVGVLIRSCIDFYSPLLSAKFINLKVELTKDAFLVSLDEDMFKQCLINGIQNAIEALGTSNGNSKMLISTKREDGVVVIEISDTGIGLPQEIKSKLFSPFFTTKQSGTGLGLSNIQKIISAHGGRVEFVDGGGGNSGDCVWKTTLRMSLPLA